MKTIDSLFLLKQLSQKNFHVTKKVSDEMVRLETNSLWTTNHIEKPVCLENILSISTLNTRIFHKHLDDIVHDEDLMESMIICFQETYLDYAPQAIELNKFNFNIAHFVHGVLTCVDKSIDIKKTKNYSDDKVELVATNLHVQQSIWIFNIYAAPFASIASIIHTIAFANMELVEKDNIVLIVGDFNVDIHARNHNSKVLQQFMQSLHMQEITNSLLQKGNPVIDHIWTNMQTQHCEVQMSDAYWTDHDILHLLVHLL